MALFERMKGEFYDIEGRDYTIRIYKEEISESGSRTYTLGGDGFIHEYYGDKEDLWDWIKYSKVTVPFMIRDATDKSVMDELLEGNEGDWYMKITDNSDANVYFQGIVLIDQSEYPNTSYPYALDVVASDGLSIMQDEQIDSTIAEGFFDAPLNVWFLSILDRFNFNDFGSFKFDTCFRMWNGKMLDFDAISTNRDPLVHMFVDPENLVYKKSSDGLNEYTTYGDLLKQLCQFLNCQLMYSYGRYWLLNIYERATNNNLYLSQYRYSGSNGYVLDPTNQNGYETTVNTFFNDSTFDHRYSFSTNNVKPQSSIFLTKPAAERISEPIDSDLLKDSFDRYLRNDPRKQNSTPASNTGTNVPEKYLVRVIRMRDGMNAITIKGDIKFTISDELSTLIDPLRYSAVHPINFAVRLFFVNDTSNSTVYEVNYGGENVYNGSTWSTGASQYVEVPLGELKGEVFNKLVGAPANFEQWTNYQTSFEYSIDTLPSTLGTLRLTEVIVGYDQAGNEIVWPSSTWDYAAAPGTVQFYETSLMDIRAEIKTNEGVENQSAIITYQTNNTANSTYSYKINLDQNSIIERDEDYYGLTYNWLRIFEPDAITGNLDPDKVYPGEKEWSETIAGAKNSFLRKLNHRRLLEMTSEPYLALEGGFRSLVRFYNRIIYDSKNWVFSSGVFNGNLREWNALLIQVKNNSVTAGDDDIQARFGGNGSTIRSTLTNNRTQNILEFDYLALTDGTTAQGATTSISVRDPRTMNVPTDTALIIYNPQTGDSDDIVLSADWTGEGSTTISIDAVSLSADYPDGSLIQIKPHQFIDYTQRVLTLNQAATSNPNDVSVPRTSYIFTTNGSYTLPTAATFTTALIDTIDLINQSGVNITVNLNGADTLYQGSEDGVLLYPNSVITLRVTDTTEFTII